MINTVYRLVAPRRFEIAFEDIDLFGDNAIVRPTNLAICNADMRYYLGTRDAKVLAEKFGAAAEETAILYGGSCKPSNAAEIFAKEDVDGGLIGGAALKAEDFLSIGKGFAK